jgi:hypothetical protein
VGARTHGTIALVLGAAAYEGTRRAVAAQLVTSLARRFHSSSEQLTPPLRDPPSAATLVFVAAQALASPTRATAMARKTIERYSITEETIERLTAAC